MSLQIVAHSSKFILFVLALLVPSVVRAQSTTPTRPAITGLSHIALYCHDIDKSREFYEDFLGFAEPYSLKNPDDSLRLTFIKINDRQFVELFPEKEAASDRLYHVALETDDAEAMRQYLASQGVKVPTETPKGRIGNANFFITDPDGRTVEIVQYLPDSLTVQNKGKYLPDSRISTTLAHVGIMEGDLDAAKQFFEGILGFKEIWRGAAKDSDTLSWVHEQVPDGAGFLELMLYSELPDPDKRGGKHHLCLEVPDLELAKVTLASRAEKIGYTRPMEIQTGVNRKRQLNLFDPDGTRVELMEPRTTDGAAAPSSTAPPPHRTNP
jgi:catechol 2,3-dioxygenase-like lactoylglutathione lyase family enzyme